MNISRKFNAAQAFATVKGKVKTATFVAVASSLTASQAFALSAEQNTAISTGYTAVETTVAVVVAGLLGVILGIAGWSIVKGLLK